MKFVFLLCCALCCSFALGLTACANEQPAIEVVSDQEVITKGIQKTLDPLATPTRDGLEEFIGANTVGTGSATPTDSSLDVYELLAHVLRGFSYTVDAIDVQGNNAEATLTVKHIDTTEAMHAAAESTKQEDSLQQIANLFNSEDPAMHVELGKQLIQRLYSSLDASQSMVSDKVTLTLTKNNNEWVVSDSSATMLVDAIFSERR